jgi:hypothetical protein
MNALRLIARGMDDHQRQFQPERRAGAGPSAGRFDRASMHPAQPSMSRKGTCWDNAVAESFFSSLKKERIKKQIYKNRDLAIADVAQYIDSFCNSTRRHSHLGGVSPEQFEAAHKPLRKGLHSILGTPYTISVGLSSRSVKPLTANKIEERCRSVPACAIISARPLASC